MKRYLAVFASLLMTSSLTFTPAQAGDEGWAALGGFFGGALFNEVVNHRGKRHNSGCGSTRSVYSAPRVHYAPAPPPPPVYHAPKPRGHWETRTERVWVPGQWIKQPLPCGGYQNAWQPGYHTTRTRRVWVENSCGGGHHRHGVQKSAYRY